MSDKKENQVEEVTEEATEEAAAAALAAKFVAVRSAWRQHKGKLLTGGIIVVTNALAFAAGIAVGKADDSFEDGEYGEDDMTELGRLDVLEEAEAVADEAFSN